MHPLGLDLALFRIFIVFVFALLCGFVALSVIQGSLRLGNIISLLGATFQNARTENTNVFISFKTFLGSQQPKSQLYK